jgi:hypothetical protein
MARRYTSMLAWVVALAAAVALLPEWPCRAESENLPPNMAIVRSKAHPTPSEPPTLIYIEPDAGPLPQYRTEYRGGRHSLVALDESGREIGRWPFMVAGVYFYPRCSSSNHPPDDSVSSPP